MVVCEIVTGGIQMLVIGAYLPPSMLDRLPDLEEALNSFPDRDPILIVDLNADIG